MDHMNQRATVERKIIHITGKRQVTIPQKFFEKLRFGKEVECVLTDDAVVLRPLAASDDNFMMDILKDLVSQGFGGDALLEKFAQRRAELRKAVGVLIEEADEIASGKRKGASTRDIFGEE